MNGMMDLEATVLWTAHIESGDQEAREAIAEDNMRLVHHMAHRIRRGLGGDIELDELVDAGCIGLMQAIDAYDPGRGLAFSTFAIPRIRGAILDDLRRADVAGRDTRRRQRMIAEAEREVAAKTDGRADAVRVAGHMDIDVETLHRWKVAASRTSQVSLDSRIAGTDGQSATIGEVVADDDAEDVEERIGLRQEAAAMRREFRYLTERERIVLTLYYYDELKLREIADVLGITESRVSQIRSKALETLRSRLRPLRDDA